MKTVFLDTVGLLAIWNDSDQWHSAAQQAYSDLRAKRSIFVTTRYVLLECGNTAARTAIRKEVTELRINLTRAKRLISPTDDDWEQAWDAYDRGEAGAAGIVDQVSFVVMRGLGLTQAFTNDWHFKAAGLETLF